MTSLTQPDKLYRAALIGSDELSGFYNKNVPVQTDSGRVLVRIPLDSGPSMDLRIWPEADILRAANEHVDALPRLLFASEDPQYQVHEFIDGQLLDVVAPRGVAVPQSVIPAVAKLFSQLARVPAGHLPQPPAYWPTDGDTAGFLGVLVDLTQDVWNRYSQDERYKHIYDAFGFPPDPLEPLAELIPKCGGRPFHLVHADVHRKNMMLVKDSVVFLDWELGLWGDPVYDLAVHLHKMDYKSQEEGTLIRAWRDLMSESLISLWEADLPTYLTHERLKSAIVDTVRYSDLIRSNKLAPRQRDARISQLANKLNSALAIWGKASIEQAAVDAVLTEHANKDE